MIKYVYYLKRAIFECDEKIDFLSIGNTENERTEKLALRLRAKTDFVKQSFFNKAPYQVEYEKLKKDLISYYLRKYAAEADYSAEIILKCLREFPSN